MDEKGEVVGEEIGEVVGVEIDDDCDSSDSSDFWRRVGRARRLVENDGEIDDPGNQSPLHEEVGLVLGRNATGFI